MQTTDGTDETGSGTGGAVGAADTGSAVDAVVDVVPENPRDAWRRVMTTLTVNLVLAVRAQYLAGGANAIDHWDQLATRMRVATRTTVSPEQWVSTLLRRLKINTPSVDTSRAADALAEACARTTAEGRGSGGVLWLNHVDAEFAFILARCRVIAEERKAAKDARREEASRAPAQEGPCP